MNFSICKKCKHCPTIFKTYEDNFLIHCLSLNFPSETGNTIAEIYVFDPKLNNKLDYLYKIKPYENYGMKIPDDMKNDIIPNHNCPFCFEHQLSMWNK